MIDGSGYVIICRLRPVIEGKTISFGLFERDLVFRMNRMVYDIAKIQ